MTWRAEALTETSDIHQRSRQQPMMVGGGGSACGDAMLLKHSVLMWQHVDLVSGARLPARKAA
jgi:hypothetical protein